jgi:hypothetical protein
MKFWVPSLGQEWCPVGTKLGTQIIEGFRPVVRDVSIDAEIMRRFTFPGADILRSVPRVAQRLQLR